MIESYMTLLFIYCSLISSLRQIILRNDNWLTKGNDIAHSLHRRATRIEFHCKSNSN